MIQCVRLACNEGDGTTATDSGHRMTKQLVHEYLYSNNKAVTRVQKEVKTATASEEFRIKVACTHVQVHV